MATSELSNNNRKLANAKLLNNKNWDLTNKSWDFMRHLRNLIFWNEMKI